MCARCGVLCNGGGGDGGGFGQLAIYFFDFHRFGGGGSGDGGCSGGNGVGGGRGISWYDPLLTDSSILLFIEKALRTDLRTDGPTDGRTDLRMDGPSYRDARMHLKTRRK